MAASIACLGILGFRIAADRAHGPAPAHRLHRGHVAKATKHLRVGPMSLPNRGSESTPTRRRLRVASNADPILPAAEILNEFSEYKFRSTLPSASPAEEIFRPPA